jgi:hypothetical protein
MHIIVFLHEKISILLNIHLTEIKSKYHNLNTFFLSANILSVIYWTKKTDNFSLTSGCQNHTTGSSG